MSLVEVRTSGPEQRRCDAELAESCPLCQVAGARLAFSKKGWKYWRCSCGHVFVSPLPSEKENRAHYERSYSSEQLDQSRAWFEVLARKRMDLVEQLWRGVGNSEKKGMIVDAGCGYGFFLREAHRRGWPVLGIDCSGGPADYAVRQFGLRVIRDDIASALRRLDEGSVAVLTFWHVLEHHGRPGEILDESSKKLAQDGLLFLNSPNLDSAIYRLVGSRWNWIYTPGHVQYFSTGSLARAIEKRGFAIARSETWTHAPNLYFLVEDSLLHALADLFDAVPSRLAGRLGRRLRTFAYSPFNQQVLQLKLFKVLYDHTPLLDRHLKRRRLGHEFLLVASKPSPCVTESG